MPRTSGRLAFWRYESRDDVGIVAVFLPEDTLPTARQGKFFSPMRGVGMTPLEVMAWSKQGDENRREAALVLVGWPKTH